MSQDKLESGDDTVVGSDELSDLENVLGLNLDKAKPIGLFGTLLGIGVALYFLANFIISPTVFEFLLVCLALFGAVLSAAFRSPEKEFVQGMKKLREDAKQSFSEGRETMEMFGKTQNYDVEDAEQVGKGMKHEINPRKLLQEMGGTAPLDRIGTGENLQYLLSGFDLDIDGNDEGSQSQLIVTDKRIIMVALSITAKSSQYTISFRDMIGISLQQRATSQIRIQTAGHSYKISVARNSNKLATEVIEFIQRQKDTADGERQKQGEESPLDDLEKLADLQDKGVISETEFEEKKQALLGEI